MKFKRDDDEREKRRFVLLLIDQSMNDEQFRSLRTFFNRTTTSIGRFYEKRHQFEGALDQYSKALKEKPNETTIYVDRSRVFLQMGNIDQAQKDTGR